MGYTHYWTIQRNGDQREWSNVLARVIRPIIDASPCPLDVEYGDQAVIINGSGPCDGGVNHCSGDCGGGAAHETLTIPTVLSKMPLPESYDSLSNESQFWDFCKTARKSYDTPVTAILATLAHYCPSIIEIESDGEPTEWALGVALARLALDDGFITVPPTVKEYEPA